MSYTWCVLTVILSVAITSEAGVISWMGSSENEVLNTIDTVYPFNLVSRSQWASRIPKNITALKVPTPYVVIHHSYTPQACYDHGACCKAMRSMQDFHMDDRGWWDIGYNFAVGSDGSAYEGRGWTTMGAHALNFNSISIGICIIGDWREKVPVPKQLKTAKDLIAAGVKLGYISPNYKLVGHGQVRATECPGNALQQEIKTWKNYSPFPASVDDLPKVPELAN